MNTRRIPARTRRTASIVLVLMACTVSLSAFASDEPTERKAPRSERPAPTTGSRIVERGPNDLDEILVIGAINDPADASQPEDVSVPSLPVDARTADAARPARRGRTTTGSRIPVGELAELDEVRIVGAVNDPADADVVADTSLPELPVMMASTPRGR